MNKNKTSETISGVMAPYGFDSTGYDSQDRLTAWNRTDGNLDQSWNLSKEGDWNSFTENGLTENRSHTEVHELTSIDATPLLYDSKGNLTQNSNDQTYTWDFDNRMASATVPTGATEGIEGTHSYAYDALGRRVSKTVDTTTTTVIVCTVEPPGFLEHAGQVLSEYSSGTAAASPERSFASGTYIDEPVLLVDSPGASEQLYYYHANSLHSVAALTDDVGGVVERYAYAAYGAATVCDAAGISTGSSVSTAGNPYTFTGRRVDSESGLQFYRARYYDVFMGRFITRDPIDYAGSPGSLYEYVDSNPLGLVDPTGLTAETSTSGETEVITTPPGNTIEPIDIPSDPPVKLGPCAAEGAIWKFTVSKDWIVTTYDQWTIQCWYRYTYKCGKDAIWPGHIDCHRKITYWFTKDTLVTATCKDGAWEVTSTGGRKVIKKTFKEKKCSRCIPNGAGNVG